MVGRVDAGAAVQVTGAIIAGGSSRRMGVDKRGLLVQGIPLLQRVASALAVVSDELLIACRRDSPPEQALLTPLGARLVFDRLTEAGPLAGLEAALAAACGKLVVVAAADMPWIEPAVLRLLLDEARREPETDAVTIRTGRGPEPLLCVYRPRVLPTVTRLLDGDQRRMHALLAAIAVREIPPSTWRAADPSGRTAVNLNAPADLTGVRAEL